MLTDLPIRCMRRPDLHTAAQIQDPQAAAAVRKALHALLGHALTPAQLYAPQLPVKAKLCSAPLWAALSWGSWIPKHANLHETYAKSCQR